MAEIIAGSGMAGKTCPFCQTPIKPTTQAHVCDACGIPHHTECWRHNGGCTTFGCAGVRVASGGVTGQCPLCGYMMTPFEVDCPRCEAMRSRGVVPGQAYAQPPSGYAYQPPFQPASLPAELRRWNWGAFAISPIWCAAMGRWGWFFGIIVLNMIAGIFSLAGNIYLGVKGNELAWQSRHWRDLEHFRATQDVWNAWGIGLFVLWMIVLVIAFLAAVGSSY